MHQKWLHPCRVIKNGDIVLVKDENLSRNLWQLARVYGTHNEEDGLVRKVRVAVGDKKLCGDGNRTSAATYLERPAQKLVVLLNLRTFQSRYSVVGLNITCLCELNICLRVLNIVSCEQNIGFMRTENWFHSCELNIIYFVQIGHYLFHAN